MAKSAEPQSTSTTKLMKKNWNTTVISTSWACETLNQLPWKCNCLGSMSMDAEIQTLDQVTVGKQGFKEKKGLCYRTLSCKECRRKIVMGYLRD